MDGGRDGGREGGREGEIRVAERGGGGQGAGSAPRIRACASQCWQGVQGYRRVPRYEVERTRTGHFMACYDSDYPFGSALMEKG